MTWECERCGALLGSAGYPCERCQYDPMADSEPFGFDGGRDLLDDPELLTRSAKRYCKDLAQLVDDLSEEIGPSLDQGRALFALDKLQEAQVHLEAIGSGGEADAVDRPESAEFGPTNGGVTD